MDCFLKLEGICKSFFNVVALNDVCMDINKGEIHVLIGENGAGKSTLMKILAGHYKKDSGRITIDGKECDFSSPLDAMSYGVSMIHQELLPIPDLTVAENIFLGREPTTRLKLLDKKAIVLQTQELFSEMNIDINPREYMRNLSVAQLQLVEIAKAVSFNSEILIMDEPTSALSDREIDNLYEVIFKLRAENKAVIFISHKLDEIFKVADKITVLRDGEFVGTKLASELDRDSLITMMVGRNLDNVYVKKTVKIGPVLLEVKNLTKKGLFEAISFTLKENEVLGIAGLMGAGRTELVETIFGLRNADSGQIFLRGKEIRIKNTWTAKAYGIALIPEDRKLLGLNLKDTTGFNISIADLSEFEKIGILNKKSEQKRIDQMIEELNVKVTSRDTMVRTLSGGNQQKVVLSKWLMTSPSILIMDEPTRGIDIGAKTEIYKLISEMTQMGKSIIMVSSELNEIIGMSDRVVVLSEGKLTGELVGKRINSHDIMRCATTQVG